MTRRRESSRGAIGRILGAGALLALLLAPGAAAAAAAGAPLTERAAVTRALAASPTLRAAVLELRAAQAGVTAEEARYTPTFYATAQGGHTETLGASLQGIAPNRRDTADLEAGVTFGTAWGTELDVAVGGSFAKSEVTRDPSTDRVLDLGQVYGAEARVALRQPLLRGAGKAVGEAELRAARQGRAAATAEHARAASALLRDVLSAYWELWYAEEAAGVQGAALDLAERQRDEATARAAKLGTVAATDALRFDAEAAALAAQLARTEADREARALALGGLLALPPAEGRALRATGDPAPLVDPTPPEGDVAAAVVAASAELRAIEAEIAQAREQLRVLDDARLPTLDLEASLALGGLWNDETLPSLGLPSDRPAVTALVGLRFELPLTSTRADAELARVRYTIEAAEARLVARRQALEAEVAAQAVALESAQRRVTLAERAETVAAELARAEAARLDLGLSTPLQVVEAREQERAAALERLRAVVDANTAAIAVAHETGTLLPRVAAPL